MIRKPTAVLPLLALLLVACGRSGPETAEAMAAAPSAQPDAAPIRVDSILPMDVALERFRADLREPTRLTSGAGTRDALVRDVIVALAASDTAALARLAVDRAEWAWLYFPTSPVAKPPYELPPGLAWMQLREGSRKGALRALRELGGHRLDLRDYTCAEAPRAEGDNRLWTGCRVTLSRDGAEAVTLSLFGAILERDGHFAILSFTNDF